MKLWLHLHLQNPKDKSKYASFNIILKRVYNSATSFPFSDMLSTTSSSSDAYTTCQ